MNRRIIRFSAAALMLAAGAACAPVMSYSGFRSDFNSASAQPPQVGVDTKTTIQQRFGTPSTTSVMDTTSWYYVSSTQEQVAFYAPKVTQRHVMVVRFNGDTVSAVDNYGMERGRVIAYDNHSTPTRGRELGILEQIFGNIGSTPINNDDENRQGGGRPRSQ